MQRQGIARNSSGLKDFSRAGLMHTEVLQVAGEEWGAEQAGFGQDIKNGLSKSLKDSSLLSSSIFYQHDHASPKHKTGPPKPIHLRLSSAPLQYPIKGV